MVKRIAFLFPSDGERIVSLCTSTPNCLRHRSFVQESAAAAKFRTKTKGEERKGEAEKVATKNAAATAAALLLKEGREVSEAITNVNLRHSNPLFPSSHSRDHSAASLTMQCKTLEATDILSLLGHEVSIDEYLARKAKVSL